LRHRRVLVTGGAGFIGSHLVDRLVNEGLSVAVVDNLSTGNKEYVNGSASLFPVDLADHSLADIFEQERPDVVFHLAAQASVTRSMESPEKDARTNILGTLNLLEQCRRHNIERIVYSSTGGALYGEPDSLPCDESHPVRPLSPYGASKYAAETYIHTYGSMAGFRYTILRYANVYGPRQDSQGEAGVIAIFSQRMLNGESGLIYGNGEQQRDFLYVEDVVEANIIAMDQEGSETYNIGTGVGTSVNAIYTRLAGLTGYAGPPTYEPARKGEVFKIYLNNGKAERELHWTPSVDLESGLGLTVEALRSMA
jgi:UDP-glucose 4-epimerase